MFYFCTIFAIIIVKPTNLDIGMSTNKTLEAIKSNDLFRNVDFDTLNFPFDAKNFLSFKENELVYSAGQNAEYLYLIINGEIKVKLNSVKRLLFKSPNQFFGELEILQNDIRTSSALADCDCLLYKIDSGLLENLCASSPALKANLSSSTIPKSENNISIKKIEEPQTVNSDIVLTADTRKFDLNVGIKDKPKHQTNVDIDKIQIKRFEQPPDLDDFIQEKYRKSDNKSLKTQMIDDMDDMNNWVITEQLVDVPPAKKEEPAKNVSTESVNDQPIEIATPKTNEKLNNNQVFDNKKQMKQFSNFILQDVKTPLIRIKHYSTVLSKFELPDEVKKVIGTLTGQTNSVLDLLQAQIDYSDKKIKNKLEVINFDEAANQSLTALSEYVESRNVKLFKKLSCFTNVKIDNRKFYVACYYILKFACDVMKQGGSIYCTSNTAGSNAVLTIRDENKFIKSNHLEDIFNPDFINENGDTIGLSLAISKFILESVGGSISVQPGESGTSYLVSIPVLL